MTATDDEIQAMVDVPLGRHGLTHRQATLLLAAVEPLIAARTRAQIADEIEANGEFCMCAPVRVRMAADASLADLVRRVWREGYLSGCARADALTEGSE